jgi:hypothetical protein
LPIKIFLAILTLITKAGNKLRAVFRRMDRLEDSYTREFESAIKQNKFLPHTSG